MATVAFPTGSRERQGRTRLIHGTALALGAVLAILGSTLLSQEQTSVSWVPYQTGCPILLDDLRADSALARPVFESIDLQNVSAEPVDEIMLGILSESNQLGAPQSVVATWTVSTRIAPGERRRVPLQLDARQFVPVHAAGQALLMTLGVLQVRRGGSSLWVSAAAVAGSFNRAAWPPNDQPHRWCLDERHRLYSPGALLFDAGQQARMCHPDGTWGPR